MKIIRSYSGPQHKVDIYSGTYSLHQYDEKHFLSGGDDHRLKLWNLETGELVAEFFRDSHHGVISIAVSSDKRLVATGHNSAGGVHCWDMETRDLMWANQSLMYVSALTFSPDDKFVLPVSSTDDGKKPVYDASNGDTAFHIQANASIEAAVTTSRPYRLYEISKRNVLSAYDLEKDKVLWRNSENLKDKSIHQIFISKNSAFLGITHDTQSVSFFKTDGALGKTLTYGAGERFSFRGISALSFEHNLVAFVSHSRHLCLFELDSAQLLLRHAYDNNLKVMTFSNHGSHLVIGCSSGEIDIFQLEFDSPRKAAQLSDEDFQLPTLSAWDAFVLKHNLTINDGFYWRADLVDYLKQLTPRDFDEAVSVITAQARKEPGGILALLHALFSLVDASKRLSLAESLIFAGLYSTDKILHDPWGIRDYYAKDACEFLLTLDTKGFSDDFRELLGKTLLMGINNLKNLEHQYLPEFEQLYQQIQ